MTEIETGREDSPSEQSPLLASSSSDYSSSHESKTSVSFRRGLSIIFLMGLLIFIQGMFWIRSYISHWKIQGTILTVKPYSDEHVNDDHSSV